MEKEEEKKLLPPPPQEEVWEEGWEPPYYEEDEDRWDPILEMKEDVQPSSGKLYSGKEERKDIFSEDDLPF